eukprot:gene2527-38304_t
MWGLTPSRLRDAEGYDDRNFVADFAPGGGARCLFKVYNRVGGTAATLAAQARAMGHLAGHGEHLWWPHGLRVPSPIPPKGGGAHVAARLRSGETHYVRLQTWVPGAPLSASGFGPTTAARIGALCGSVAAALHSLPAADPALVPLRGWTHNWDYYRTAPALLPRTSA